MAYSRELRIRLTILYLLWSNSTFLTLERGEKEWSGEGCQKLYRNTNPNMVDYKGLIELSPLGLPQLTIGLGAHSGKH